MWLTNSYFTYQIRKEKYSILMILLRVTLTRNIILWETEKRAYVLHSPSKCLHEYKQCLHNMMFTGK